jgi:hypothetical protein
MITLNYPQGSEDWLQARAGVATASRFKDAVDKVGGLDPKQQIYVDAILAGHDASAAKAMAGYKMPPTSSMIARALAGESVYSPSYKAISYAWTIAMEIIARKSLDETFVTWKMRQGQEREPQARRAYEAKTGEMVEEVSLILTDDEAFGYSADGFVGDDGLVEIKCPGTPEVVGSVWEKPSTAHEDYIHQINGGLWITGRKWCDLVIYYPELAPVGKELFIKRIHRDDDVINKLEADLIEFHKIVRRKLAILRGEPIPDAVTPPWGTEPAKSVTPIKPHPMQPTARQAVDLPEDIFTF